MSDNIKTEGLALVAEASGRDNITGARDAAGMSRWTELRIFHRPGDRRPFVAETLGRTVVPGEETRRRVRVTRTLDQAVATFESSRLTDVLAERAQDWLERQPDAACDDPALLGADCGKGSREQAFAGDEGRRPPVMQFTGKGGLLGALRWLYFLDDQEGATLKRDGARLFFAKSDGATAPISESALADQFAEDFGVPSRTVRHALAQQREGKDLPSWCKAFLGALMWFDREAFHVGKGAL